MFPDLKSRNDSIENGLTFDNKPKGILIDSNNYEASQKNYGFNTLLKTNKGLKSVVTPSGKELENNTLDDLEKLVSPREELLNYNLNESEQSVYNAVKSSANKQLIQQFYEAYISPTGLKDVNYRLGEVQSNISDLHSLYTKGLSSLISGEIDAGWRVGINYSFQVEENLTYNGKTSKPFKFQSYAFPPFISIDSGSYNYDSLIPIETSLLSESQKNLKDNYLQDTSFDTINLLYKKNEATIRDISFKSINDNINLLQYLFNRSTGVESTYINEWDLSIFIQEGIVQYKAITDSEDSDKTTLKPLFVTNLTYGLDDNAPVEENVKKDSIRLDLDKITPFASFNMAVSTRKGIGSTTSYNACNLMSYEIADYPLSSYWLAPDDGKLNTELNVSEYINKFFNYKDDGVAYAEPKQSKKKDSNLYIPTNLYGTDLYNSPVAFEYLLAYNDDRKAILSGWNATDIQGSSYEKGKSYNNVVGSNSFSFLPYWKQFFFNSTDGMEDIDQYWQEVESEDKAYNSFISVADDIINIITEENNTFNGFKATEDEYSEDENIASDTTEKSDYSEDDYKYTYKDTDSSFDEYGNIKVKILGHKITIPHTKLLNMFLNRGKSTSKAMKASEMDSDDILSNVNVKPLNSNNNKKVNNSNLNINNPDTANSENTKDIQIYSLDEDEDTETTSSRYSYADGVNNFSPFLYGGPHGKYYSPLTLEGFTQVDNPYYKNIPTMDRQEDYYFYKSPNFNREKIDTKNFKYSDKYSTAKVMSSLNERNYLYNLDDNSIGKKVNIIYKANYSTKDISKRSSVTYTTTRYGSRYGSYSRSYSTIQSTILYENKKNLLDNVYKDSSIYYRNAYQYWDNVTRQNTDYITKQVPISKFKEDIKEEFVLFPVPRYNRSLENISIYPINYYRSIDNNSYKTTEGIWGKIGDTKNFNARFDPEIRYLVASKDMNFSYIGNGKDAYNNWYSGSDKWTFLKKSLYNSLGESEFQVTLPILRGQGGNNSDIINITTICANIEKTETWVNVKKIRFVKRYRTHYYKVRIYNHPKVYVKIRYRKRIWRWFRRVWRWYTKKVWYRVCRCRWVTKSYRTVYWVPETYYVLERRDVYNMYVYPNKINYSVPTKNLINNITTNDEVRDFTSNNVLNRWKINENTLLEDLHEYFPFSNEFINKFGDTRINYWKYPGLVSSSRWNQYTQNVLHIRGILFTDLFKNYKENNCIKLNRSTTYKKDTIISDKNVVDYSIDSQQNATYDIRVAHTTRTYHNSRYGGRYGYYTYNYYTTTETRSYTDKFNVTTTENANTKRLTYTSTTDILSTDSKKDTEFTSLIENISSTPAVLQFNVGTTRKYQWFNISDIFNIYQEICKSQVVWLNQLSDYVKNYISDYSIYNTYKKITDKRIVDVNHLASQSFVSTLDEKPYITDNMSEDINYEESLYIIEKLFNKTTNKSSNTLYSLLQKRISDIKKLYNLADTLKNNITWLNLDRFSYLISNTYSVVNNVNGIDNYNWLSESYTLNNKSYTYDLLRNPTTIMWAYLNVLYQARKFYINKRLDKVQGSYWILRSLERVLTFQTARQDKAELTENPLTKNNKNSDSAKSIEIKFVQTRDDLSELSKNTNIKLQPSYTKATYVKVNYLTDLNPLNSNRYKNNLYNDREIVYVPEVYKWAYKPKDGYYYVMSKDITSNVKDLVNLLSSAKKDIELDKFTVATGKNKNSSTSTYWSRLDKFGKITEDELKNCLEIEELPEDTSKFFVGKKLSDLEDIIIYYKNNTTEVIDNPTYDISNSTRYSENNQTVSILLYKNRLLKYLEDYYYNKINSILYKIYIEWTPSAIGVATNEIDVKKDKNNKNHFIDEWQYQQSLSRLKEIKASDSEYDTIETLDGNIYEITQPLKSGITFGVVDGVNVDTILSNLTLVGTSTSTELACSIQNKSDYWRVEIPSNLNIPVDLLEDNPVLVSAYELENLRKNLTGEIEINNETTLIGLSSKKLSPIKEIDRDSITATTNAALGQLPSIQSLGLDVTYEKVEKSFG